MFPLGVSLPNAIGRQLGSKNDLRKGFSRLEPRNEVNKVGAKDVFEHVTSRAVASPRSFVNHPVCDF